MIHFHRVLFSAVTCIALAGLAGAQITTLSIPHALKTAGAIDNAGKEKIQSFVAEQFKRLVSPDPAGDPQKVVHDAREALGQDAKAGSQAGSAEYQAIYTEAVAVQAKAAFAGTRDIRVKLNIAIVVAKVAENAPQARLEPAVLMLLGDAEPVPLQIWGIRAARHVIPELARIGSADAVIKRVVAIVKGNPSGPLADDAYDALRPTTDPKLLAVLVDPLLTLAEVRIAMLQAGYAEDPFCDYKAFAALAQIGIWGAIPDAQRVRTMQLMANVMVWASFRADERKGSTRDQLGVLINKSAGSLTVMASITALSSGDTAAGNLASMAKAIYETSGGLNTANITYTKLTQPLVPAIIAVKSLSTVKVPPAPSAMSGNVDGE